MVNINPKLEKYIFEELGGVYSPSYLEAVDNLGNDEERNLRYLGTYFPRTFVESYYIYDNLFSNLNVYEKFLELEQINILIIGSGTGGDLVGLLSVLNRKYSNKQFVVYSFDGNNTAINYQIEIAKNFFKYSKRNGNTLNGIAYTRIFENSEDLGNICEKELIQVKFHIVQSFKFGNELYNSALNKCVFFDLMAVAEKYLYKNGIFVMEDVTIKNIDGRYNPCVMTNQVRKYYKKVNNSDLVYVIPKVCGKWKDTCKRKNCFSQVPFYINHRFTKYRGDISKVTFKVFIKKPLGNKVLKGIRNAKCYQIAERTYCTGDYYFYNETFPPMQPCDCAFEL